MEILGRGKAALEHLLNNTKNKAIPCPREKLVMIAMNAALEDVYKKVFAIPINMVHLLVEGRENAVETLTE